MEVKERVQETILKAISEIGTNGATIVEIEKKVDFERHTLSKYLSFMQGHGLICHKNYGKAKVWFINKAPIQTILNSLPEKKTFTEKILYDIITNLPSGLIVLSDNYDIQFMNEKVSDIYGRIEGQKFYTAVAGQENPMKLKHLADIIWGKSNSSRFELKDKHGNSLAIRATKLVNPDKSVSIILIVNDITSQKKYELLQREGYGRKNK